MAFYRICPDCGAYLDPGEQCSCHEEHLIEMERKEKATAFVEKMVKEEKRKKAKSLRQQRRPKSQLKRQPKKSIHQLKRDRKMRQNYKNQKVILRFLKSQ